MGQLKHLFLLFAVGSILSLPVNAADPPVKKSANNICHPKGGTYYKRTKNYTPYQSMKECIKSGGRKPRSRLSYKALAIQQPSLLSHYRTNAHPSIH